MARNNRENKASTEANVEVEDFINLGIIINDWQEVLMIRRAKPEIGKNGSILIWAFPGGKQRLNESRSECVKREILSETGYDINPIKEISLRPHPQFPIFIIYHLCELTSLKPVAKPSEPHEVAEVRWVKIEEIKNLIKTNLDPKVTRELGL